MLDKINVRTWFKFDFNAYPPSVRDGIILLLFSWMWHIVISVYLLRGVTGAVQRQVIGGLLIIYFVMKVKKWARPLCILASAFLIMQFLPVTFTFFSKGMIQNGLLTLIDIVLFGLSSFFLLKKESAEFYKEYNKKDAVEEEAEGAGSSSPTDIPETKKRLKSK